MIDRSVHSILIAVLVVAFLSVACADSPKGVSVNLRAKWPGTPILLEASEILVTCNHLAKCNSHVVQHAHSGLLSAGRWRCLSPGV